MSVSMQWSHCTQGPQALCVRSHLMFQPEVEPDEEHSMTFATRRAQDQSIMLSVNANVNIYSNTDKYCGLVTRVSPLHFSLKSKQSAPHGSFFLRLARIKPKASSPTPELLMLTRSKPEDLRPVVKPSMVAAKRASQASAPFWWRSA